jgi:hypothetical protein
MAEEVSSDCHWMTCHQVAVRDLERFCSLEDVAGHLFNVTRCPGRDNVVKEAKLFCGEVSTNFWRARQLTT